MSRLRVFVPVVSLVLVAGCQAFPTVTTCPPGPETVPGSSELTPGDFVEWEQLTLDYANGLVGMAEDQAENCALDNGFAWRVVGRDGEFFPVTADYSPSRINATIARGIVESVSAG